MIKKTTLTENQIAIAIKDQSSCDANNIQFLNNEIGVASYIKKPNIYSSPTESRFIKSSFSNNKKNFQIQDGSIKLDECVLDGQAIKKRLIQSSNL